jgi:FMN-dependent oxidoreductase (nitrilotriacetate monooxygenase family)
MFLRPAGHHVAAWRHPGADADAGFNFQRFVETAKLAERGLFDMLFLADTSGIPIESLEGASATSYVAWIEPFSTMVALAGHTKHIGLICTSSTSFEQPYSVARKFASLDLISGGRGGWNLITSVNPFEFQNFGPAPQPDRDSRYDRAREFASVVLGLWNSWDADAFVMDRAAGRFFDPAKVRRLDHKGAQFHVRGPLNVARSPQGQPVLVQAGASELGMNLAAETADVVFAATPTVEVARKFYSALKEKVAKCGRNPEHVLVMPGFQVMIGRTEQEARDRYQELLDLIPTEIGVQHLSQYIDFDLRGYPVDGPLPDIPLEKLNTSRTALLSEFARKEKLTIRQLYQRISGGRGHFQTYGTPKQIADIFEEWTSTGAADGFNYLPPILPGSLHDFIELVIPELQRRGLYRTRYGGSTLRENLGLPMRCDAAKN